MALENNRLLTYNDLNSFLTPKGTPLTGNRIATKSAISANYYVDEMAQPYMYYSTERCPAYQYVLSNAIRCDYFRFEAADYEDAITYYDCDGIERYIFIPAFTYYDICARNEPYPYIWNGNASVVYLGNCPY